MELISANPWASLLFSLVVGTLGAAWLQRTEAFYVNLSISVGVVAATGLALTLTEGLSWRWRLAATLGTAAVTGLLSYELLWIPRAEIKVFVRGVRAARPPGSSIGGIQWLQEFREVYVEIENRNSAPVEQLDIVLVANEALAGVAQTTNLPGISVYPKIDFVADAVMKEGNSSTALNLRLAATETGYRLQAGQIPPRSRVELVLAVGRPDDSVQPSLLRFTLRPEAPGADSRYVWYATTPAAAPFLEDRLATEVGLTGSYLVRGRSHELSLVLPVQFLEDIGRNH